ncbi:MAG: hypothetical protein NUV53_03425 [Patescibacteria group bacterium]|nr:hypothetical protein [Patescibacteria group bacterium]
MMEIKKMGVFFAGVAYVATAIIVAAQVDVRVTTTTAQGEVNALRVQGMNARLEDAKKDREEKIRVQRAEFQVRLKKIQDEKKKQVADTLFERLETLNEKWTTHFSDMLDKYDLVLKKVGDRRDTALGKSLDVASVTSAIRTANEAILSARKALDEQAEKTYSVDITTDAKLREAFQSAHESLKKDLMGLRDTKIREAREATHNTIQTLRNIPKPRSDSSSQ